MNSPTSKPKREKERSTSSSLYIRIPSILLSLCAPPERQRQLDYRPLGKLKKRQEYQRKTNQPAAPPYTKSPQKTARTRVST